MSKSLAIIGVGYLGRIHLKKIIENQIAGVSGFYEINAERAKEIEQEFGVRKFNSVEEALRFSDAIIIASPTLTHYEIAKQSLRAGIDTFVEKPLAEDSRKAFELADLAEKNNLILQVGHIERFNPAFILARKMITNPMFIEAHRLSQYRGRGGDVAVVFDLMIHDIDLVLELVGEKPSSIYASAIPVITKSEDIANARLEFPSGTVANLTSSRISIRDMRKIRVFQKSSYISVDLKEKEVELISIEKPEFPHTEFSIGASLNVYRSELSGKGDDPISLELGHFIRCIENRERPIVSGKEAYWAITVAEKIIEVAGACRKIF
jgi:predicted dehydrogenase